MSGLESRVIENYVVGGFYQSATIMNIGDSINLVQGNFYFFPTDEVVDATPYTQYKYLGPSVGSYTLGTTWIINNSDDWVLYPIGTTPTHATIALDNSNSPAVKFIETIAEDEDGMAHYQVFAQEMEFNATDGDYADDIPTFPNLTNGTADNLLGADRVRTIVASVPLNKYIGV